MSEDEPVDIPVTFPGSDEPVGTAKIYSGPDGLYMLAEITLDDRAKHAIFNDLPEFNSSMGNPAFEHQYRGQFPNPERNDG